ncbi:FAS1-like dehydratase domain-containing protein [Herbiconiux sp. P16]|uniref:FAS1-like dehydratase domain-containing protein n=1 Tax=Herbiconiux wuyangfengii TaxID=3342794 RepID=UPI0035BAD5C5
MNDPQLAQERSARATSESRYLTDEVKALVGVTGPVMVALRPLTEERLRRFVHGVMETQFMHTDPDGAASSKFGGLVATPLWPTHAFVRELGDPDPLDALQDDPEWDGIPPSASSNGLPPIPTELGRLLNGGTEAVFRQMPRIGDVISSRARYSDVAYRDGTSGPFLVVKVETTYTNQDGDVLAIITVSIIRR